MCAQKNPLKFPPDKTRVRIGQFDRAIIEGVPFKLSMVVDDGYLLDFDDGSGRVRQFGREELRDLDRRHQIEFHRNFYHPDRERIAANAAKPPLSELSDRDAALLSVRSAFTEAVEELHREGHVKITDHSIADNMDLIAGRAHLMMASHSLRSRDGRVKALDDNWRPKAGTLRKWVAARRKFGLDELVPAFAKRGGEGTPLHPEVAKIMWQEIPGYLTFRGPGPKEIWQRVRKNVDAFNKQREKDGLPVLRAPSKTTVAKHINKLDAFQVMIAREGEETARKKFRPTTTGVSSTRPLERVEIDEHKLDLWTLIDQNEWHDMLSEQDIERLGLRKGKGRLWITLAICCTTKVIVGVTITPSPTSDAALQTLEMIVSDKGKWSDLVGAHRSWNMYGLPEKIVSDCGAGFRAEIFRHACAELGIIAERVKAGVPEMRGVGERIFRTVNSGLCRRLAGSTFHDLMTSDAPKDRPRGDDRAALTLEDLSFALVRWVVDIYHVSAHEGLLGESPADCWDRLTEQYGVNPSPSAARIRLIFGSRLTRVIDKTGVTILGIRYHSETLAAHMNRKDSETVDVRWHPSNIGVISVRIDGRWHEIPAVVRGFDGVPAETWLMAARHSRHGRRDVSEVDIRTALDAMAAIDERSDDAILAAGLKLDRWSPERIANSERRIFSGVTYREPSQESDPAKPGRPGTAIDEPVDPPRPPSQTVRSDGEDENSSPPKAKRTRKIKPKPLRKWPRSGGSSITVEED